MKKVNESLKKRIIDVIYEMQIHYHETVRLGVLEGRVIAKEMECLIEKIKKIFDEYNIEVKNESSIYDEVITHEEAKILIGFVENGEYLLPRYNIEKLFNYVNEQQAKEERAKKVEELWGLYREQKRQVTKSTIVWFKLEKQIEQKEKMLKDGTF